MEIEHDAARSWRPALLVASCVAALLLVVLGAVFDSASVADRAGLGDVALGLPFDWVVQDRSGLDPPSFPRSVGFEAPQEASTRVTPMFFGNLALVAGAFLAVALLLRRSRR